MTILQYLMQIEEQTIDYRTLTYLQYIIKPKLFIQYLNFLNLNLQYQVPLLFDSFAMTLFEWIDKLPKEQKTLPFRDLINTHKKFKRIFLLLLLIGKYCKISKQFIQSFKGKSEQFISYYQEQLLSQVQKNQVQKMKMIFNYFRQFLLLQKVKQNITRIQDYNTDWIKQDFVKSLLQKYPNQPLKNDYINLIKEAILITQISIPQQFMQIIEPEFKKQSEKKMIDEQENGQKQQTSPISKINQMFGEVNSNTVYKIPGFLQNSGLQQKISYLEYKLSSLPEFLEEDLHKYKFYCQEFLKEAFISPQQRCLLYSIILNIRIIQYANNYLASINTQILHSIEVIFKEIKQLYQLPLRCAIHLMSSLSYLQNFVPNQGYANFHKLISSIMLCFEKQKDKKQYSILVLFLAFFSLRLSENKNLLNFSKFWKHILQSDNKYFLKNICSIRFIDSLTSFNCLVMSNMKTFNPYSQLLYETSFEDIFANELAGAVNVQIQSSQSLSIQETVLLLKRKYQLSKLTKNQQSSKTQQSSIQIMKHYAINKQPQLFIKYLSGYFLEIYLQKINNMGTTTVNHMLIKIIANILFARGFYILSWIAYELSDEHPDHMKLHAVLELAQRSKQPIVIDSLKYCSASFLKIILKYSLKVFRDDISAKIIQLLQSANHYQYYGLSKKGRLKTQLQYEFIKYVSQMMVQ